MYMEKHILKMNQPFVELQNPLLRSSECHSENSVWGSISSYWSFGDWEAEWLAQVGGRQWEHTG